MISLYQKTWKEINNEVASNVQKLRKRIRKRKKISQKELAERSGVSLGSIKRFEQTGEISLQSLTKIAIALRAEDELESLFTSANFESIEEILNGQS